MQTPIGPMLHAATPVHPDAPQPMLATSVPFTFTEILGEFIAVGDDETSENTSDDVNQPAELELEIDEEPPEADTNLAAALPATELPNSAPKEDSTTDKPANRAPEMAAVAFQITAQKSGFQAESAGRQVQPLQSEMTATRLTPEKRSVPEVRFASEARTMPENQPAKADLRQNTAFENVTADLKTNQKAMATVLANVEDEARPIQPPPISREATATPPQTPPTQSPAVQHAAVTYQQPINVQAVVKEPKVDRTESKTSARPTIQDRVVQRMDQTITTEQTARENQQLIRTTMAMNEAQLRVSDQIANPEFDKDFATAPMHRDSTAPVQHSSLPTATTPSVPRAIANQMAVAVSQNTPGVTELVLSPEELGRVRMVVTAQDSTIAVVILAERPETTELLRRNIEVLAQEFRSLGYSAAEFQFEGEQGHANQSGSDPMDWAGDSEVDALDTSEQSVSSLASESGLDLRL